VNHLKDVVEVVGKKPKGIMVKRPNNSIAYIAPNMSWFRNI
jgi:hypothetical protein